jgi:uncharacterized protein YoaH (UPF0181 family)
MAVNEQLIAKHMKTLGISREDAIQLIADDLAVDRMSTKEVNSDLTAEQQKAVKSAKQADRKPTVYKFDTSKRKRAENTGKRALIETVRTALEKAGCADIEVTNVEREIIFHADGTKYKIVLSAPRT